MYRTRDSFVAASLLRSRRGAATYPWCGAYTKQQAWLVIPPTERLTQPASPLLSNSYMDANEARAGGAAGSSPFRFAVKEAERGLFEHGVTPEAKDFIAEAEAAYQASSKYLHEPPGGVQMPETERRVSPDGEAVVETTRIAAPFGDRCLPSRLERFAHRHHAAELLQQSELDWKPYMLDEQAQLSLRKERQLAELLSSPMPVLPKAEEVSRYLLSDVYPQRLALQPRSAESVMVLFSQASLVHRMKRTAPAPAEAVMPKELASSSSVKSSPALDGAGTLHSIPFLGDMRRLYAYQKQHFVSPTPLLLEHLMATTSAATVPHSDSFHLANRLLLDADRYVVLPTRATYTCFFTICQLHHAMVFALARFKDAVVQLDVSADAAMLTALLKGLNHCGHVDEAVALLSRIKEVGMTTPLMNAALETLLLSSRASSCFSLHQAMRDADVKADADTYTLLLLACEKTGQWSRVTAVLADMQRRRVRGNRQTLNLLLKGLLQERLSSYAVQLYGTMREKQVEVWPALEAGVQRLVD